MSQRLASAGRLLAAGAALLPCVEAQCDLGQLTAPAAEESDHFGISVAVGGGTAVVGAYLDDPACPASPSCNSGAAHVFELGPAGWVAAGTLVPADAAAYDQFGHSVSISGDRIAVGSHQDGDAGTSSGAAYVFARSGSQWLEEAKLVAPDGAAQDQLGRAVAIAGERVLAGAPFDDDAGEGSGAAYVFELAPQGWVPTAKLTAPGAAAGDWFGYAVALDGDRAVVGAPQPYNGGRGAAYVFDFDGLAWQPRAVLAADDGQPGDRFGDAVAVYGAVVVAGAPSHDGGATGSARPTCTSRARGAGRSGPSWARVRPSPRPASATRWRPGASASSPGPATRTARPRTRARSTSSSARAAGGRRWRSSRRRTR